MGAGKILEINNWMTGIRTHDILLTGKDRRQAILLTRGGVPKDQVRSRYAQEEEGRMTPSFLPFVRPGSLHAPHFC